MIALTVRHYFLVVNLMAIPPGLWVLALAQGFSTCLYRFGDSG